MVPLLRLRKVELELVQELTVIKPPHMMPLLQHLKVELELVQELTVIKPPHMMPLLQLRNVVQVQELTAVWADWQSPAR